LEGTLQGGNADAETAAQFEQARQLTSPGEFIGESTAHPEDRRGLFDTAGSPELVKLFLPPETVLPGR
jgi:hypothetical protein